MRTRTVREGSVGLLILLGLGLFGALILWLRGLSVGNRTYQVIVEFANVAGLQEGAPVRYRGVVIGKIESVRPGPNGVDVFLEISSSDLVIPSDVIVEANQSGLISETSIDLSPRKVLPQGAIAAKPLAANCDPAVIVCDGSRLKGQIGISVDELIRASIRFAALYSDPTFFRNVNAAAKNTAEAAVAVSQLSKEIATLSQSTQQNLNTVSSSAVVTADALSQAATQVGLTANQVSGLVTTNRNTLAETLGTIRQTSEQLQVAVQGFTPVLSRVEQSTLLNNLEALSANAAQASVNLRDVSQSLNNPTNTLVLQQTLDSARATFQNAQKITSDLDELTGDPTFRNNLRNLVNGLSGLVSSTEQLQQQAQLAQVLAPLSTKADAPSQRHPESMATVSNELEEDLRRLTQSPATAQETAKALDQVALPLVTTPQTKPKAP
ncbi:MULTISPECIES: MlaD family protein [Trichocoleus]|uniref:MlaD family protein n=1 Tax=Trichocoleus desertorum GB2-A4 TaxID=2933944 RepID=A0ABV0J665_9CYAN|nr:MlaD family protein [Trichocoleus sp. FACHB-46]MBD1863378.1 MCE family protein [Trichocoleus sp. FACHB-46]